MRRHGARAWRRGTADIHNSRAGARADEILAPARRRSPSGRARRPSSRPPPSASPAQTGQRTSSSCRRELAARLGLERDPVIVNDAVGALRCGAEDTIGVAAVSAPTRHRRAERRRRALPLRLLARFDGRVTLGEEGLAAIWRHMIGLGPPTSLLERALERWSARTRTSCSTHSRGSVACPSPSGRASPTPSSTRPKRATRSRPGSSSRRRPLGDYARVWPTARGSSARPFPLVLCGGVLRHPSPLLRASIHGRAGGSPSTPIRAGRRRAAARSRPVAATPGRALRARFRHRDRRA